MKERCKTSLLDMAVEVGGPADGKPLLLLHGWPDDASTWDGVAPALQAAGYRTIAPTLRGFGDTRFLDPDTFRSGEMAALTADILELAEAYGLERFSVIGHDWGARIAYILAGVFPERLERCIALSVSFTPGEMALPPLAQVRAYWYQWFLATDQGAEFVRTRPVEFGRCQWDTWSPPGWFTDESFAPVGRSFLNPDWPAITLHSYRVRWGEAPMDPRHADLARRQHAVKQIAVPTLMVHGADDRCTLQASTDGREPYFSGTYRRVLLDGVGHFPTREAPEALAPLLVEFLAG